MKGRDRYRSLPIAMAPERLVGDMEIMKPPEGFNSGFNPKKRAAPKNHSKRPRTSPNQAKQASTLKRGQDCTRQAKAYFLKAKEIKPINPQTTSIPVISSTSHNYLKRKSIKDQGQQSTLEGQITPSNIREAFCHSPGAEEHDYIFLEYPCTIQSLELM